MPHGVLPPRHEAECTGDRADGLERVPCAHAAGSVLPGTSESAGVCLAPMRSKEDLLAKLREQTGFLRRSLEAFYCGDFEEAVRIATAIRVLVHETGGSKPLLKSIRPDGLELPILDHAVQEERSGEKVLHFIVGIRPGPGASVAPAVDLGSALYGLTTIGTWWRRPVFVFRPPGKPKVVFPRKKVILVLANKEGGAHVDQNEDPDYASLLVDRPLRFELNGGPLIGKVPIETPNLARFLAAQAGVEMLECLKRNFFPQLEVPPKWECGAPGPGAQSYLDEISVEMVEGLVWEPFPTGEVKIANRQ